MIVEQKKVIKTDKYTELVDICSTTKQEENLLVTCPGLLLDINTTQEKNSCFKIQVITKEDTLKTVSICESNEKFLYTNEVLDYKQLLPIEVSLLYKATDLDGNYLFESINITKLDEEYLQEIVNRDIQSLIAESITSTTIKNSVDFCPTPASLSSYITEENKEKYSDFYENNISTEEVYREIFTQEFQTNFADNWTNPTINLFFGCESASRLGYDSLCSNDLPSEYQNLALINLPSFVQNWEAEDNTENDLLNLKNLSLISDGIRYTGDHLYYSSPHIINELFQIQNDTPGNQNVFCYNSKLYSLLANYNTNANEGIEITDTLTGQNLETISSFCTETLNTETYDKTGIYLKSFYTIEKETAFTIYEKCNNLYLLINE